MAEPTLTLSFLTYNVFIGTAAALCAPKTPLLGGARLRAQVAGLRALSPDVLALQELHRDGLRDAYAAAFSRSHATVSGAYFNAKGLLALAAWRGLAACALLALAWGAAAAAAGGQAALRSAALQLAPPGAWAAGATAAALAATFLWLHGGAVAVHFLTGRVHGGLALLLRRSALAVRATATRNFAHQSGDALNWLRPRAFQVCLVEVLPPPGEAQKEQQQQQPPRLLLIVHTHANLGHGEAGERCRAAQLRELLDASSPSAVQALLEGAGLGALADPAAVPVVCLGDFNAEFSSPSLQGSLAAGGFEDACAGARAPTWDNANPLTNGVLLEPDARVDLVLFRRARAGEGGDAAPPRLALQPLSEALVMNEAPYCSDHFGVLVRFACQGGSAGEGAREGCLRKGSWDASSSSISSSSSSDSGGGVGSPGSRSPSGRDSACSDCSSLDDFPSYAAPSPANVA
jgi:endonuclease/exonuclease/phosphatase family metal-dependent hydrolase